MKIAPIISVKNLIIKSKRNTPILQDVSFEVEKGEFVLLVGKTGSGKSTLLKSLYLDIEISSGDLTIFDKNLTYIDKSDLNAVSELRLLMGIIFQDFQLLSDRTIEKNLEFILRATNWKEKKIIDLQILEVLQKVNMTWALKKMPHELSGGEQQRICIARAMLNNPKLILADEPTGNLDEEVSIEIFNLFKNLNENGTTILLTTHNPNFIKNHSGKILKFNNGFLIEVQK